MMVAFVLMTMIAPLSTRSVVSPRGPQEYALLALALGVWLFSVRMIWRARLLSRYLSMDLD